VRFSLPTEFQGFSTHRFQIKVPAMSKGAAQYMSVFRKGAMIVELLRNRMTRRETAFLNA
jgi:hypothetical protein